MGFKANFGTGDFSSVPYGTQDPAFENSVIGDWDRRIPDIETYDPEKKSGSCSIKTSSKTLVFQMFAHGYHGYHQDLPIFFAFVCHISLVPSGRSRSLLAALFLVLVFGTAITLSDTTADFRMPTTAMLTLFQISVGSLAGSRGSVA